MLTGDPEAADALVQAAIVKFGARRRRVSDAAHAEAAVRAEIRTIHIATLRRRFRRTRVKQSPALPDVVAGQSASATPADEVAGALATLTPRVRAVVAMYYWEDLAVAEIASAMRVSEGTVRGLLDEGRTALAPLLGNDDEPERLAIMDVRS